MSPTFVVIPLCLRSHPKKNYRRCVVKSSARSVGNISLQNARQNLLNLIGECRRGTEVTKEKIGAVEDAVQKLCDVRNIESKVDNEGEDSLSNWEKTMTGKWRLLFSTEGPLLRVITPGALPFVFAGLVYQTFDGNGSIANIIEFENNENKLIASLRVEVSYSTKDTEDIKSSEDAMQNDVNFRLVKFVFRKTKLNIGRFIKLSLPFAIGRGTFEVLYLAHDLRVDLDESTGSRWINIYSYAGPITPCTVSTESEGILEKAGP